MPDQQLTSQHLKTDIKNAFQKTPQVGSQFNAPSGQDGVNYHFNPKSSSSRRPGKTGFWKKAIAGGAGLAVLAFVGVGGILMTNQLNQTSTDSRSQASFDQIPTVRINYPERGPAGAFWAEATYDGSRVPADVTVTSMDINLSVRFVDQNGTVDPGIGGEKPGDQGPGDVGTTDDSRLFRTGRVQGVTDDTTVGDSDSLQQLAQANQLLRTQVEPVRVDLDQSEAGDIGTDPIDQGDEKPGLIGIEPVPTAIPTPVPISVPSPQIIPSPSPDPFVIDKPVLTRINQALVLAESDRVEYRAVQARPSGDGTYGVLVQARIMNPTDPATAQAFRGVMPLVSIFSQGQSMRVELVSSQFKGYLPGAPGVEVDLSQGGNVRPSPALSPSPVPTAMPSPGFDDPDPSPQIGTVCGNNLCEPGEAATTSCPTCEPGQPCLPVMCETIPGSCPADCQPAPSFEPSPTPTPVVFDRPPFTPDPSPVVFGDPPFTPEPSPNLLRPPFTPDPSPVSLIDDPQDDPNLVDLPPVMIATPVPDPNNGGVGLLRPTGDDIGNDLGGVAAGQPIPGGDSAEVAAAREAYQAAVSRRIQAEQQIQNLLAASGQSQGGFASFVRRAVNFPINRTRLIIAQLELQRALTRESQAEAELQTAIQSQ